MTFLFWECCEWVFKLFKCTLLHQLLLTHICMYFLPKQLEKIELNDLGHFRCSTSNHLDWAKGPKSEKLSVSLKNFISHAPKYEIASGAVFFLLVCP